MLPVIAISIGDINGIGPEVILKAFARSELFSLCRPVVFGVNAAMEWYASKLGLPLALDPVSSPDEAKENVLSIVKTDGGFDEEKIGTPTEESGRASIDAITQAYRAVAGGAASALVTAPISKEAIALAGSRFKGHTDMLASLCGHHDEELMVMTSNTMKVGLVTIHIPLRNVPDALTKENILKTCRIARRALVQDFGIPDPHLAVLALNPHGGEGGFIGMEETELIVPAVQEAVAEGMNVQGPFPSDGFFSAHNRTMFDMILAMYHDQGLIPFKMQAAGRGVNVTCGLPFVRTSPDHGTAYPIAAKGQASAESMKEAILHARKIADNRKRFS
jgi:4-phospho-D-threonate 3-dehydrogenase / 4-phospho-D-erythronate 3-dehydrogenase